ncbi:MAG: 50S ribosomal protein L25 [Tissierellaceae bacterium]|nr:50S ribosomal protein L25 [Tissierellaceae bacterium]
MSSLKMKVESRENIGSNKVNKLRANNVLPGVIYKRGSNTEAVQVQEAEFLRVYKVAGSTSVVQLDLNGEVQNVIIKEIQRHPVKNQILHIDFQELNMDEKIKMTIPINLINRDSIRLQPSVLTQMLDQVEIECLPDNIPNTADVDVADMTFSDPILVSDLDIAKNEKITMLTELDAVVCTLSEPAVVETDEDAEEADDTESEE